jgi:hypothetical protein
MKITFNEYEYGADFVLEPETPKEVAQLARIALNASSEKPNVYLSFNGETPICYIDIRKRKPSVQVKSISPKTK